MIVIKHFRGHKLRSFISSRGEKRIVGRCVNCKMIIASLRQCSDDVYFSYMHDWVVSEFSTDISHIPTCREVCMEEALK